MKTADLIPLILIELNSQDMYGFELTKSIQTKSDGKIDIKQPTLYTVLKKLEKSKFISSYWQDSEIGGKRHYYKITDNGRMQVSTLPSFDELVKIALDNDEDTVTQTEQKVVEQQDVKSNAQPKENIGSIFDMLPVEETIIPSQEVFSDDTLDVSTELEINKSNISLLKDEKTNNDEIFATNENVTRFTEKTIQISEEEKEKIKNNTVSLSSTEPFDDKIINISCNSDEIKSQDYFDFSKNECYIKSKNITNKLFCRVVIDSVYILLALILSSVFKSKVSAFSIVIIIISLCVAIFLPLIFLLNKRKFILKYRKQDYNPNLKKQLIVSILVCLASIVIALIVSVCSGANSLAKILSFNNFNNFYIIILVFSTPLFDALMNYLLLIKPKKVEK